MHDKLQTMLPTQFNNSAKPTGDTSMKELLLATTPNCLDYEYMSGLQLLLTSLESAPIYDIEAIPGNSL